MLLFFKNDSTEIPKEKDLGIDEDSQSKTAVNREYLVEVLHLPGLYDLHDFKDIAKDLNQMVANQHH